MSNVVEIEKEGDVGIVRSNREAALNALSIELASGIVESLIELDCRDDVSGIVLTGKGDRAFCAGVFGQQEAYAKGEPQAVIDAFLAKSKC